MKKLLILPMLSLLLISSVLASCEFYAGDQTFNLPTINTTKTYDDGQTHKMYLACMYDLNGVNGFNDMLNNPKCRTETQTFNPTTEGNYTYNLAIAYMERAWNATSRQWQTISSGTDQTLTYNFQVCGIPDDTGGWDEFVSFIKGWFCTNFHIFCGGPYSAP